jgi:hypothetical protein
VVCAAADQGLDAGTCDPHTGACSNPAKADGTTCDGGICCTGACLDTDACPCLALNAPCVATAQCCDQAAGAVCADTLLCGENPAGVQCCLPHGVACQDNCQCCGHSICYFGTCF